MGVGVEGSSRLLGKLLECRVADGQAAIGADAMLAEAVRLATDAVLNAAAKEQGQ